MNRINPQSDAQAQKPSRKFATRVAIWLLKLPIHVYRYGISPLIGPRCRFVPTCSQYALEALERHGPIYGTWLTIRRVCRCHPFGGHGYDPVPDATAPISSHSHKLGRLSR